MATIQLPKDFKDFLRLLNANGVDYLLIGGYAVIYYGYPRTTGDMDIWFAQTASNVQKLVAALRGFGFGSSEISEEVFLQENKIHRMGIPPFRIELLTEISGVKFPACWPTRVSAFVDDIPVSLIDLDNLKVNKRASGRPKDLNDLKELP